MPIVAKRGRRRPWLIELRYGNTLANVRRRQRPRLILGSRRRWRRSTRCEGESRAAVASNDSGSMPDFEEIRQHWPFEANGRDGESVQPEAVHDGSKMAAAPIGTLDWRRRGARSGLLQRKLRISIYRAIKNGDVKLILPSSNNGGENDEL